MDKWADFCISKLSLESGFITSVIACPDNGDSLGAGETRDRNWMVNKIAAGNSFCSVKRNELHKWKKINDFKFENNLFSWGTVIPENLTCRKTFVSFYHHDDQEYREKFDNLFGDLIVNKSLNDGDIDSDNSDEYCKKLIQNGYLDDTTVLVVLVGAKTWGRMHVDWEISGALDYKVGDCYAGVLALFLPSHPSFGQSNYQPDTVPNRLHENIKSGYAVAKDWTDDNVQLQKYIEQAFAKRCDSDKITNKEIPQLTENLCD